MEAVAFCSSTYPAYVNQLPRLISLTFRPVFPSRRYFILTTPFFPKKYYPNTLPFFCRFSKKIIRQISTCPATNLKNDTCKNNQGCGSSDEVYHYGVFTTT